MAVKTGAIFNSLIFGGINSADYGIYITGEAVYNAPERAVEMVSVPGRNGAIVIDQGHWNNIQVTYPAGTFGKTQEEFREAVSAFRNAVLSQLGYQRLTDTYHPDEYRMAVYVSGLEVDPTHYGAAGEFKLKFDCKPQRWLAEGEQEITVGEWGETETATGTTVTIENPNGILAVKSLEVELEPIQDLNGYDHPWAGGAGKNKLQNQATSQTINGITWTANPDGTVTANGTATASSYLTIWGDSSVAFEDAWEMTENMRLSCDSNAWPAPLSVSLYSSDGRNMAAQGSSVDISAGQRIRQIRLYVPSGQTVSNIVFYPMLRASGTSSTYEPYSNICPISGHTEVETVVSPTTSASDGTTYTTALGRTVYGGTLDVASGELTVDRAMVDLGSLTWIYNTSASTPSFRATLSGLKYVTTSESVFDAICSIYATTSYNNAISSGVDSTISNRWNQETVVVVDSRYTDATTFKTAMNGVQLVYELATPQTYQLTPTQVELLTGTNNIWSDGDITAEYGQDPDALYNPTPYDASPLLMVEGYGTIGFNGYEVEIINSVLGDVMLAPAGSYSYGDDFPITSLMSGDIITLNGGMKSTALVHPRSTNVIAVNGCTVTRSTTNIAGTCNVTVAKSTGLKYSIEVSFPDNLSFACGEGRRTFRDDFLLSIDCTMNDESTQTFTDSFSVSYSYGAPYSSAYPNEGEVSVQISYMNSSNPKFTFGVHTDTYGSVTAYSTLSLLGHPTYIDCDLGDAYMIKDGSYISLNSYIDLGSDLPVLASGNNPVTKDSTITELKIVPRYWIL